MTTPTIRNIHDSYDSAQLSPVGLTEDFLKRAAADETGSFLTIMRDRALIQARAAEKKLKEAGRSPRQAQPLFGVPLAIKDVLTIEGVRTTCGSKILENYIAPYTATCVRKLEDAGAIIIGKLNMDEFAMGGSNENSSYGPVKHPTHPDRVPGGSSGGSAAAVRAGHCVASLGSDTGGSVRLPASYCGIVGLKPTYGRISRYGLVAFASSLDQVGPMANSVEDVALLMDVMCGHDPKDSTSSQEPAGGFSQALGQGASLKNLKIGIPREYAVGGLAPAVEKSIGESLKWFEAQGAKLVPISLPHTPQAIAVYYLIAVAEASSNLARYDGVRFGVRPQAAAHAGDLETFYQSARSAFGPEVKRRIILGTFALSSGYADAYYRRACQVRRLIQRDYTAAFSQVDLIAGPVAPTTAFKLGEKISDPLQMYLNDIFTVPANLAGHPALSIPCGADEQGLSIGLHLQAPPFAEAKLLSVAHAFEKRTTQ